MIVTIDGPAGAGKSTVAREVAQRLGFHFLDTGAMYRAVAYAALRAHVAWNDTDALIAIAQETQIEVSDNQVFLNGEDVTQIIRKMEVTQVIHHVADCAAIRARLVELQREATEGGDFVTEGRDQGTVVFPEAECKIFLTGSSDERARRRMQDLARRGEIISFEEVLRHQNERDRRDYARPVGALRRAEDAIEISTDGMELHEVIDRVEYEIRQVLDRLRQFEDR
jgi:cytidylate kinase/pantoate ligase/cytidylate kinase